ncbi:hypothetical protein BDZ94DRAFT_1249551 [Collybia nuda]|uniref:Uncharacterized protein n=1 Tax=Collybia nuda TaxID=64659 RepID=A0A9P6CNK9_9AGAR|nr:hypothetical protein BDZ94DRAFT_1249551 [Collybia nuda]
MENQIDEHLEEYFNKITQLFPSTTTNNTPDKAFQFVTELHNYFLQKLSSEEAGVCFMLEKAAIRSIKLAAEDNRTRRTLESYNKWSNTRPAHRGRPQHLPYPTFSQRAQNSPAFSTRLQTSGGHETGQPGGPSNRRVLSSIEVKKGLTKRL